MEGSTAKPRGRKRQVRKQQDAGEGAAAAAAPAATATEENVTLDAEAHHPRPSLSQRVARSLRQLGASSRAQEGDDVEQVVLKPSPLDETDAPAEPDQHARDGDGEEAGDGEGGQQAAGWLSRHAHAASAKMSGLWAAAAHQLPSEATRTALRAAAIMALLLLASGMFTANRETLRKLAVVQQQLDEQVQAATAARRDLQRRVDGLAGLAQQLDSRLTSFDSSLQALQQGDSAQASAAASLSAELAQLRADLQQVGETAAAAAAAAAARPEAPPAAVDEATMAAVLAKSQLLQHILEAAVSDALEDFAADRTGMPDYALAAAGGAVVAHSAAHQPALSTRLAQLQGSAVHPQANKFLLAPIAQPGACLPFVGSSGWVDVRLAQRIQPTAFTYEHIPASIAFDIRSAPRTLILLGFQGSPPHPPQQAEGTPEPASVAEALGQGGVCLGTFMYDVHSKHPVQTFQLDAGGQEVAVDHIRLVLQDNHSHPNYTCLYRLRMHGTPV